jgi:hypothetical protein
MDAYFVRCDKDNDRLVKNITKMLLVCYVSLKWHTKPLNAQDFVS